MKMVYIVGIGTSAATTTAEGLRCIEKADILIGAERMLEEFAHIAVPKRAAYKPKDIAAIIADSDASVATVLVSGDVGFYSGADAYIKYLDVSRGVRKHEAAFTPPAKRDKETKCTESNAAGRDAAMQKPTHADTYDIRLIPGISSVSALCARLKLPWQDVALMSMHGVDGNVVSSVRRNHRTICLTGGNTVDISRQLCNAGLGEVKVYAGENLGYPEERISSCTATELADLQLAPLTVLLIENGQHDNRIRIGIPDEEFIRGDMPMTKAEIRAVTLAQLRLCPGSICYDIGAGTGSVTVEMALSAYDGYVYAIDAKEQAVELVRSNCRRFHIGNVSAIEGKAPDTFADLPAPDTAFIGGSSGNMQAIVESLVGANPAVRIVANAVALENINSALNAFQSVGLTNIEVTQICAARAKHVAGLHMMTGMNPVTVISGGGHE